MATEAMEQATDDVRPIGDPPSEPGPLMGPIDTIEGMAKVARAAVKLRESQDPFMERFLAQWRVNSARRRGVRNAKVIRDMDEHWTAWFPRNASPDLTPDSNKAARLCRRFVSLMFTDPPAPEVEPPSGDDNDEAAAEFSTRALIDLQSESNLNTVVKARRAFDQASDFGSGFVHYYIDPRGGGRAPIEIEAHPDALTLDDALVNPATGLEEGPYVTRYVRPDGTLTDDEAEAATRWLPAIKSENLTGRHVRLIPHTARDIWDAHGAIISMMLPWGTVKRRWTESPAEGVPAPKDLPLEVRQKLFAWRPEKHDELLPAGRKGADAPDEKNDDERLVYVQITYFEQCEEYEEGLYLVTLGDLYVAERGPWIDDSVTPPAPALIPLSQFAQFEEGRDSWPHVGLMELIGGADEARAAQIANLLDHLEKLNNRKILLPFHSSISPQQLQQPRASVLYFNPGGKPEFEDIPSYPRESLEAYQIMGQEMDDDSGLQQAGQGLQSPSVESGRHAYAIISQVHAGLSEPRLNIERGYTRCCRIELQMARRFYTSPRRLKWVGDDGSYKERAWSGADLVSTQDVRVKPGTLTMLSPAAKAQFAEHLYQLGLIPLEEMREIMSTNIGGMVGLQDDPHRLRIKRQLAEWDDGPPEGWTPPQPVLVDPTSGQPVDPEQAMILQASGVPLQEMPGTDPTLARIFAPVPADSLPDIAMMRLREIARVMASVRYERKPPEWRAALDAEFERMQMAAQPPQPVQPGAGADGMREEPRETVGPEGIPIDAVQEGVPPELMGV